MMKVHRTYALTTSLAEATSSLNRSATISNAIVEAANDPLILVDALRKRVLAPKNDEGTTKVTLTLTPQVIEKLDDCSKGVQLPIEHVLRLALEAHLSK